MTSPADIAFAELFEHDVFVRDLARALVPDDASDAAQEAWLAAMTRPPRTSGALRHWLACVVRGVASNLRRGAGRRIKRERRAARAEAVDAEDIVVREETRRRVLEAVLALEAPERTVVLLRWFDGRTPTEIARLRGEPIDTVKSRLKRAHSRLRERLRSDLGGDDAWVSALLPLAGLPSAAASTGATTTAAASLIGVALMTVKAKAAWWATVSILAIVAVVAGGLLRRDRASVGDAGVPTTDRAAAVATTHTSTMRPTEESAAAIASAPFVDQQSVGPTTELTVLTADGRPLSASVSCIRNGVVISSGQGRTGPNGVLRIPADGLPADVVIAFAFGAPPFVTTATLDPGRVEVRTPAGASIHGRVLVEGAPPLAPLLIYFRGPEPLNNLKEKFGIDVEDGQDVLVETKADGSFRIDGLPEGKRGMLCWPSGYFREGESDAPVSWINVVAPAVVDLNLKRLSVLRGRIVAGDARLPFKGADIRIGIESDDTRADAFQPEALRASSGEDGAFCVVVRFSRGGAASVRRLRFYVADATGGGARTSVVDGPFVGDRDLGDIVIGATRLISVRACDEQGGELASRRIFRAVVDRNGVASDLRVVRDREFLTGSVDRAASFTVGDVPGEAIVVTARGRTPSFWVVTPDHPAQISLPTVPEPKPRAIKFVDANGAPVPHVCVTWEVPSGAYEVRDGVLRTDRLVPWFPLGDGDGEAHQPAQASTRTLAREGSRAPASRLRGVATDVIGTVLSTFEVAADDAETTVVVTRPLRQWRFLVVDENGAPQRAKLQIMLDGRARADLSTDERGEASIDGVAADEIAVIGRRWMLKPGDEDDAHEKLVDFGLVARPQGSEPSRLVLPRR